jgi:hypothetical protein
MSWNYRLFKQDTPKSVEGKYLFFVGECYYDKKGKPELHSGTDHNHAMGNTISETKEAYKLMAEAFKAPVIELDAKGIFKK